jgi:CelD/BcsL family acetyltransferase involved in cellulose biosynthesis
MAVEWIEDPTAFVSRDWSGLAQTDPEGTIFHTPRYLKLYWEEFPPERLLIGNVTRGGEALATAAFGLTGETLAWLGGLEVTDYMGPVGLPEAREGAAKELLAGVAGREDWREAELIGMPRNGAWLRALLGAAADVGLEAEVHDGGGAPFLDLPASYDDDYLARLPGKLRHELRRKERRFTQSLPNARMVDAIPASLHDDLTRFFALHRASSGAKGKFMVPGMELFFRRLGETFIGDDIFRLAFLESDGDMIAAAVGFRWRDRFLLYNSAYDHGRSNLSPGIVLVERLIRSAIDEGRRGFDLLKDELPYKLRFGAHSRRLARLRLRR